MGQDESSRHSTRSLDTDFLLLPGEQTHLPASTQAELAAVTNQHEEASTESGSSSTSFKVSVDDASEPLVAGMFKSGSAEHVASHPSTMAMSRSQGQQATTKEEEDDLELEEQPQCRICLLESDEDGGDFIAPCRCKGSAQFVHRECLDQWRSVKEGFAFTHCTTCKMQYAIRVHTPLDARWRMIKFRVYVTRDALAITLLLQAIICIFGYSVYVLDKNLAGSTLMKLWGFESTWEFYYVCGLVVFFLMAGMLGCGLTIVDEQFRTDIREPCLELCACCCVPCSRCGCHCNNPYCETVYQSVCYSCAGNAGNCLAAAGGLGDAAAMLLVVVGVVALVVFAVVGLMYSLVVAAVVAQRIWQRHQHVLAKLMLTEEYVVEDLAGQDLTNYTPPPLPPEHEKQLRDLGLFG